MVLLVLAAVVWGFSVQAVNATRFVIHTHEVLGGIGRLQFHLYRAEAEQRGFLISGDPAYIDGFRQASTALDSELDSLAKELADNPRQQARLAILQSDISHRVQLLEKNLRLAQENSHEDTRLNVVHGTAVDRRIDSLLSEIHDEESRLLGKRQGIESDRAQATAIGFLALVLLLALAVPVLYYRYRNNHRARQASAAEAAQLVAVIDNSPDVIATSSPEGKVSYLNRAARTILELGDVPVEDVKRETIYAPWAFEIIKTTAVPTALAKGYWSGESAFRTPSGREVPVSQVIVAHRQPDGSMTLSTIARDISSIKATEKLLAEKNRQIEQASRMKTEFLATMSHELRTPLNAIIGFSSVIRDGMAGDVPASAREYAQDIFDSGRHLLALINDILDLSTIESGNMKLSLGAVDGDELAANGLAIIREQANSRGIRLTQQISPELKALWLDVRKTRQIIFNLLSNAVKFSGDGTEVTLSLQKVPRGRIENLHAAEGARLFPLPASRFRDFLEIRVTDQGVGISTADLYRLFQPFTQLDSSRNRPHEGTGLGLVMIRRLAELQSGALLIRSMPGQGSCFTVWLPLHDPECPESAHINHPLPALAPQLG